MLPLPLPPFNVGDLVRPDVDDLSSNWSHHEIAHWRGIVQKVYFDTLDGWTLVVRWIPETCYYASQGPLKPGEADAAYGRECDYRLKRHPFQPALSGLDQIFKLIENN